MNKDSKIYIIGSVHESLNSIIKISKLLKELYPNSYIRHVDKKESDDYDPFVPNLQSLIF